MGVHTNLVKRRVRNGVTRLIIDFYYSDKTGKRLRFVRHADLQTRDGAEREAARYHERAVLTGNPETEKRDVVTLGEFYESTFKCKVLPLYRKNTRIRYEALWRQRIRRPSGPSRSTRSRRGAFVASLDRSSSRSGRPRGPSLSCGRSCARRRSSASSRRRRAFLLAS
jgi:hypothetical protein